MKFSEPQNANYAATVVRLRTLTKLENADRLQGVPFFGLQAITDLGAKEGDLGLFFQAETQLSFEYAYNNNMHSHSNKTSMGITTQLNKDSDARGYLGDNRRVRAIRLRGHRSDALYMPISSLSYLGVTEADFKEGDTFDKIGEHEICRKYVIPTRGSQGANRQQSKKPSRVDPRVFPEHFETRQFLRVQETLNPNALCVITQKLHGTSVRIGNVPVKRNISWKERLARKVGVRILETEYGMVFGSRKVIKDSSDPDQQHYYQPM